MKIFTIRAKIMYYSKKVLKYHIQLKIITLFYLLCYGILLCQCIEIKNNFRNSLKIVIFGDTRSELNIEKLFLDIPYIKINHIRNLLTFINPDIILHTGDIVKIGSKKSNWNNFSKIFGKFIKQNPPKFFPVIGNHDIDIIEKIGLANYFEMFKYLKNKRWYCVHINNHLLILNLDSNFEKLDRKMVETQNTFVKNTLQQLEGKFKLLLVNFHHPIYRNLHSLKLQKWFVKNFKEYFDKVATQLIYINGHFHNFFYHKINFKTRLIITGGAGAPLHKIVPGLINKHHIVILNITKNRVKIKLLVFKSHKKFYFKNVDNFHHK